MVACTPKPGSEPGTLSGRAQVANAWLGAAVSTATANAPAIDPRTVSDMTGPPSQRCLQRHLLPSDTNGWTVAAISTSTDTGVLWPCPDAGRHAGPGGPGARSCRVRVGPVRARTTRAMAKVRLPSPNATAAHTSTAVVCTRDGVRAAEAGPAGPTPPSGSWSCRRRWRCRPRRVRRHPSGSESSPRGRGGRHDALLLRPLTGRRRLRGPVATSTLRVLRGAGRVVLLDLLRGERMVIDGYFVE